MRFKDRQQIFVHKRFAAQDAKEAIAHLFGLSDRAIDRVEFDPRLLGSHVDPTALAAQIAAIDHRQIKNGGKNSPRLRRRLCLWTLFNPPQPNVHIAFHNSRLSVSRSRRRAMRRYIRGYSCDADGANRRRGLKEDA